MSEARLKDWRERPWLSVATTAELLSLSPTTVRGLLKRRAGGLERKSVCGRVMVTTESILAFIGEDAPEPEKPPQVRLGAPERASLRALRRVR